MSGQKENDDKNQRLLTLAAEVAEAVDREVPHRLLDLQEFLDEAAPGSQMLSEAGAAWSRRLSDLKLAIWNYDLLQVIILVLKQNYEHIRGRWTTATKLAHILSTCCIGLDPPESHEFLGICLPNAVENMLLLARKLQTKYVEEENDADIRRGYLDQFRNVLESLSNMFGAHTFLTTQVLKSSWLHQLLISDDIDTTLSVINLIQNVMRVNGDAMSQLDESLYYSLMDELVFKLTASDDINIAGATTRVLLAVCRASPAKIRSFCLRYRGLRPLLSKWKDKGYVFARDLKSFVRILEAGDAERAESERFHQAATVIQALWRGVVERRRMKKAHKGMTIVQRSFRKKKTAETERRVKAAADSDLQYRLAVARRQALRKMKQTQYQVLSVLPAGKIKGHLSNQRDGAALSIQTAWRGHRERKELGDRKEKVKRTRAAVCIQRRVRKHLSRVEDSKFDAWSRFCLTDQRRVEIMQEISQRREINPPKAKTRPEQETLHESSQGDLQSYLFKGHVNLRKMQHREALLASLHTDSELLMGAQPSLRKACHVERGLFTSKSAPVAAKARLNHQTALRVTGQLWWKKLANEDGDEGQYEGEQLLF